METKLSGARRVSVLGLLGLSTRAVAELEDGWIGDGRGEGDRCVFIGTARK